MDDAQRRTWLRNTILKAKQAYYFGGQPIMTDAEYDALEDELRGIDPDDDVLALVGAPVSADAILTKARHRMPMGSQSKVNTEEEFETWFTKNGSPVIQASLKGDGASAAAYYANGRLEQAISRGDGIEGEDITANAVKFHGLPVLVQRPDGTPFSGAVRFEVILTVENWAIIDPSLAKNPRNLGNGIMGRKNGKDAHLLTVYAFDVDDPDTTFTTQTEKAEFLEALGFTLMPSELCPDLESCVAYYRRITAERGDLPFWIDGVVLKIDDLEVQSKLGVTANRPKGQTAWKFVSEGGETTLLDYEIGGGHTGVLVPTAKLAPVEIGGTTVQNALLNNWEEVERLGVAVGDTVYVIKANDIIPKVIRVIERAPEGTRRAIEEPTRCPFCDGEVGRRTNTGGDTGVATVCLNPECPKKSSGKIARWIKGLDIQGIGDSVLEALIEQMDLENPAGLYTLGEDRDALASLIINQEREIRLGMKRATTILDAIDKTRTLSLVQLMGSLGIHGLGTRRVELMLTSVPGELDTLADWRGEKLRDPEFAARAGVPSMGDRLQDGIDQVAEVIDAMIAHGVVIQDADGHALVAAAATAAAESKGTVAITGKLPSGKKKNDYKQPLEDAGFELVDKVTRELTYLVLADPDSTSGKAKKARGYNVKLITEDELLALLEG